jgi:aminoglycoside 6'-N-acetyltransferase
MILKQLIKLRAATIDDLETLKYWDEKPHVIQSDPNDDWEWDTELGHNTEVQEHLIAELNSRPIGYIQNIDPAREKTHYWGEVPENLRAIDIWIGEESDLGKGYGTEMMRLAIERCFKNNNVTGILIDPLESNTKAHRFYERFGFQFLEKRRFGLDDCYVYYLDRAEWYKHC